MSYHFKYVRFSIAILFTFVMFRFPQEGAAKDQKLKPEELLSKHLESIGTPEARAAVRTRGISGVARVTFRLGGTGQKDGKGNMISEGQKTRIGMMFGGSDYPAEQFAYNGDDVTVGYLQPGRRSPFGSFIYTYSIMLKEGLLGGAMLTGWALLDAPGRQLKLDYTGLKKMQGKQVHEVKYRSKKGQGDLQIFLYFDPETFRHLYTQYRLVQPAFMGNSPAASSGQRDTIYSLIESYGDFKIVDGLTLPHACKFSFTVEGQSATFMADWEIIADQIVHNQAMDPQYFKVN